MTANIPGDFPHADDPGETLGHGGGRPVARLARRAAVAGLAVVVVFGLSIATHMVGAIDRLDTAAPAATFSLGGPASFETAGGHGGGEQADDGEEAAESVGAEGEDAGKSEAGSGHPAFVEVPDMLVSLDGGQGRSIYVKIGFSLELPDPGDQKLIKKLMPRIVDQCQVYLRELRRDDFRGSAGVLRLREELLRRVGHAVAPIQVDDVLLTGLVVQ